MPALLSPRRRLLRVLWLLVIVTVTVASLIPSDSLAMRTLDKLELSDKMEHLTAYAILAFLPALHERRDFLVAAALGAIALGIGLEYGQLWLGWRSFELGDMVASVLGVVLGMTAGLPLRFTAWVRVALLNCE